MTKTNSPATKDGPPKRGRRPKFVPSGTPFQVEQRTKHIEKDLRAEAVAHRRRADYIEQLSGKIEANRLAGKPIDPIHLMRAFDSGAAGYYVGRIAGLEPYPSRDELLDALWPGSHRVYYSEHHHMPGAPAAAHCSICTAPVAAEVVPVGNKPQNDALAEAVAIARSARGEDVDWSREPLTDRERRIRAEFLRQAEPLRLMLIDAGLVMQRSRKEPASDLQAALDENKRQADAERADRLREELREAAEAVDDEGEPGGTA